MPKTETPKQIPLKQRDPETWALGCMNTAAARLRDVYDNLEVLDPEAAARNARSISERHGVDICVPAPPQGMEAPNAG